MPFKDAEQHRQYLARWRAARRSAWFAEHPCVDCGATENLELDHLDPSAKVSSNVWGWSATRREAELAKCVSRCHDCHVAKTTLLGEYGARGARNGNAKLTEDIVRQIRVSDLSNAELGRRYGVARQTVRSVRKRTLWNHVDR